MALSTDIREIRARREERAPDFYQAYLNSPDWRRVRARALLRAGYRCSRCDACRDLQVHHLTYERLGSELDADLRVLCACCHGNHHREEAAKQSGGIGIYVRIVSELVQDDPFRTVGDLAEHVKRLCAARQIENDAPLMHRAITLVCGTRLKDPQTREPYVSVVETEAVETTHAQAVELLTRWGFSDRLVVRQMPQRVRIVTQGQADRLKAFAILTAEIAAASERCEELEREIPESNR